MKLLHASSVLALCSVAAFVACSSGTVSTLPSATDGSGVRDTLSLAPLADDPIVAINSGGPATSGFNGDEYWTDASAGGTDTMPVDVSEPNTAPAVVYAKYRTAPKTLIYEVPGLAPNENYNGYLFFEEPVATGAGQRVMNVSVGGTAVATDLDIFKTAGAAHRGIALPFNAPADGNGKLAIALTSTVNAVIISGFTIYNDASDVWINAGGPTIGNFLSDRFWSEASVAGNETVPVDVSAPHSAPQAVYARYRDATKTLAYHVTGLLPNTSYYGYLHFEEPLVSGPGRRLMNVTVGGTSLVTGLDIFAIAGGVHKAVAIPMSGTSDAQGGLQIDLTATVNDVIISGLEMHKGPEPTPSPTPTTSAAPRPSPTPSISPSPTPPTNETLFVASQGNSTVTVYSLPNVNPQVTISTTSRGQPFALALNGAGNLFVALGYDAVFEYSPPYNGAPVATILNDVYSPTALGFDISGNLFVADFYSSQITEYAPPYIGIPTATITSGLSQPYAMVLGPGGNIFVANLNANTVTEYVPPYTASPTTISKGVSAPDGLLLDSSGNLFVANGGSTSVTEYVPPYTAAPKVIGIGAAAAGSLAMDPAGDLFVGDDSSHVYEFAPPYTGEPILTISKGIGGARWLALDGAENLFVANIGGNTVTEYAPPYTAAPLLTITGVSNPATLLVSPGTLVAPAL